MKYKCCRHLLGGITFFFNEIRSCCSNNQGITFEKDYRGGVFDVDEMDRYRKQVIEQCKNGFPPKNCLNCIELKDEEWADKPLIDEIYINHWDHCNCGCIYCIELPHGSFLEKEKKKSRFYDVLPIMKNLYSRGLVSKDVHFEMIGGDLCVLEEAEELINLVIDNGVGRFSFHTSAIGYSFGVERALKECNCDIDFSLDCGHRELYRRIKRIDAFDTVVENLKRYANCSPSAPDKMVAKYIIIDGLNDNVDEINAWVDLIHSIGVKKCKMDINFTKFFPEYHQGEIAYIPKYYYELFDALDKRAELHNMLVTNWEFTTLALEKGYVD